MVPKLQRIGPTWSLDHWITGNSPPAVMNISNDCTVHYTFIDNAKYTVDIHQTKRGPWLNHHQRSSIGLPFSGSFCPSEPNDKLTGAIELFQMRFGREVAAATGWYHLRVFRFLNELASICLPVSCTNKTSAVSLGFASPIVPHLGAMSGGFAVFRMGI